MDCPGPVFDDLLDAAENAFPPRLRNDQHPQNVSSGSAGLQLESAPTRRPTLTISADYTSYRLSSRLAQNETRASASREQSDENIAKHHGAHDDVTHERRFACPFYKRNSNAPPKARSCLSGFYNVARLREHLLRYHERRNTCPRCLVGFKTSEDISNHLNTTERCIKVDKTAFETDDMLGSEQIAKLRQRLRRAVPEEDRWRVLYRICHSLSHDSETPSPYCDFQSVIPRSDDEAAGHDWCSTADSDSGYGPSVYGSTVDSGYGPSLSDFAPPISSYEPHDSNMFLDASLPFGLLQANLPLDFLPGNLHYDFEENPPFDLPQANLLFGLPQELNLMVGQNESQPPQRFDDNGVAESESRSGLTGTESAQPKGFVNPVEPQVHLEKCGTRSTSPPSGSMSTPATGPNSIDTNNSVQGIQDKINNSRASIDPLSPGSDTLYHDQTGKKKANVKVQAHLGAPQDVPADLLHPKDGSIPQSPSNYAKITTSVATQSHGAELKRFLISKLMKKANELLGYTTSEASSNCASSDTSSDDTLSDGHLQSNREVSPFGDEVEVGVRLSPSDGLHENERHRRDGGSIMTSSAGVSEGPPPRSGNKRRRGVNDDRDDDQDEEDCDKRRKSSKTSGDPQRKRRFACPFYKQNPAAYARCTACVWHGFENIARTKEHVYRNHREDHVCEICHETFESNRELLNHLMQPERCAAVDEPLQRVGINEDQKEKLGHRWRGIIDEEKWRKIYRICHNLNDDDTTPSPYWDDQDALASQAVEGYDQFQRNHLPSRIQMLLEAEAETNPEFIRLYENLLSRLPDVIREAQRGLYEAYTTLQGFSTTQTPLRAQQNAPDNAATLDALLDVPLVLPSSGENAASPPVAFEAPPNTENGMTVNEAHEVHAQSNQQPNGNSDSGYGSFLVDFQAESSRTNYIPDPSGFHGGASPFRPLYPEGINYLDGTSLGGFQVDQSDQNDLFQIPGRFSPFFFDPDCIDPNSLSNTDDPSNPAPYHNPSGT